MKKKVFLAGFLLILSLGIITALVILQNPKILNNIFAFRRTTSSYLSWTAVGCFDNAIPDNPLARAALSSKVRGTLLGINHKGNCRNARVKLNKQEGVINGAGYILYQANKTGPESGYDRYELVFKGILNHIYGLGKRERTIQVELIPDQVSTSGTNIVKWDILNTHFGDGYDKFYRNVKPDVAYTYQPDVITGKVPFLYIPIPDKKEYYIVAYYNTRRLVMRVLKDKQKGNTFVVWKHTTTPNNQYLKPDMLPSTGKLLVVKADSPQKAYSAYRTLMLQHFNTGQYKTEVKKPHPKAFEVGWETWHAMGNFLDPSKITTVVNNFKKELGFYPSFVILGSNYWENLGCDYRGAGKPALSMEIFQYNDGEDTIGTNGINTVNDPECPQYHPNFSNFKNVVEGWKRQGIYTMLGMRHSVRVEKVADFRNRLREVLGNYRASRFILHDKYPLNGIGFSAYSYFMDNNYPTISLYIEALKNGYGEIRGIKEDEMIHFDQMGFLDWYNKPVSGNPYHDRYHHPDWKEEYYTVQIPSNKLRQVPLNYIEHIYSNWNKYFNGDIIIMSQHDFFGSVSDIHLTLPAVWGWDVYDNFYWKTDNNGRRVYKRVSTNLIHLSGAITRLMSGQPNFFIQDGENNYEVQNIDNLPAGCKPLSDEYKYERINQLMTFFKLDAFIPAPVYSCPWNQVFPQQDYPQENAVVKYYMKLARRLSQYKYDAAMRWYEDGVVRIVQPLFMKHPENPKAYDLYRFSDECLIQMTYNSSTERNGSLLPDCAIQKIKSEPMLTYYMGDALLVRPLLQTEYNPRVGLKVYFPEGNWKCFIGRCRVEGNKIIDNTSENKTSQTIKTSHTKEFYYLNTTPNGILKDTSAPVFIKEGEIVLIGNAQNYNNLDLYVFLEEKKRSSDYYYYPKPENLSNYNQQPIKKYRIYVEKKTSDKAAVYVDGVYIGNATIDTKLPGYYSKGFYIFPNINLLIKELLSSPPPTVQNRSTNLNLNNPGLRRTAPRVNFR